MTGAGRLADNEAIVDAVLRTLNVGQDLSGETVLITAGPTREPIDPVRYLTNRSSGKMGYALADAAARRGAKVILVSGPVALQPPTGVEVIDVETAAEMHDPVMARRGEATVVIKAAGSPTIALSALPTENEGHAEFALELVPTSDIASQLGDRKQGQLVIGFAAETENVLENARQKLLAKGLDAIVANDVSQPGVGFDSDRNAVTIITPTEVLDVPASTKWDVAQKILDTVRKIREQRPAKVRS